jgi:DNA-binding transcriptional MerR regulator
MNDEEQVPQARTPAGPADAGQTPVEKLEALGVRGILWQLARDGQIIDLRCEMPQCYCFRGRRYFEPRSPPRSPLSDWSPTADHYPRLKMHRGHLTPDNVRLAHRVCNQRDYLWRIRINAMLGKRMSLEEIAEQLNGQKVPTIHGTNRWTAASVRKAFVS